MTLLASRRRRASAALVGVAVLAAAGALVAGSTSCAHAPDAKRSTEIIMPDFTSYAANVDPYLQRRCGTLDCHGQPGRAYRLYGFTGFRLYNFDAALVSGQQPTTPEEVRANYQAAVALEPEEMSRLIATQGADPTRLILLRKPLRWPNPSGGVERHKGGPAMAENDAGFKCVVAWLRIRTVRPTADGLDFETIPEAEREKMNAAAVADCAEAQAYP